MANEGRFTPFGISDILKTSSQETFPNAQEGLVETFCSSTMLKEKDDTNKTVQERQLEYITAKKKAFECPSENQGRDFKIHHLQNSFCKKSVR